MALVNRYVARAWDGEGELHADIFFQEEYTKDIVASLVYIAGLRFITAISTHIIEFIILRNFAQAANEWVCRAPGKRYHRVDKYQLVWALIGLWLPFAIRDIPFVGRRRHHYDVFPSSFAFFLLGEFAVVLKLLAVAAYQYARDMMKPKPTTPRSSNPEKVEINSSSFILDRSIWLAKRRWLARYTSLTSPSTEPKAGSTDPHLDSEAHPPKDTKANIIFNPAQVQEVFQAITAKPRFQHLSFEELRLRQQGEMGSAREVADITTISPMEHSYGIRSNTTWLKVRRFRDSIFSNSTQSTDSPDSFGRTTPARSGMIAEMSKKNTATETPAVDLLTGSTRRA